jgi:hypothetical protein
VEHDFVKPGPLGLRLRQDESTVGTFAGSVRIKTVTNKELQGKVRPDMLLFAVNELDLVGLGMEEAMEKIAAEKSDAAEDLCPLTPFPPLGLSSSLLSRH